MHTFERDIPANVNAIHKETVDIVLHEKKVGTCKLRAEGYTLVGAFQLDQDIGFEKHEFQYAFTGGYLTKIHIENN